MPFSTYCRFPGPSSKARIRHRQKSPIYFWRDKIGREIDLLVEWGEALHASEIKSSQTVASDAFDRLIWWSHMAGQPLANASLIHGGEQDYVRREIAVRLWFAV